MDFEPMKSVIAGVLTITLASLALAQRQCDCKLTEAYISKRDFTPEEQYEPVDLMQESREFEKSKDPVCRSYAVHLKAVRAIHSGNYEQAKTLLDREKFMLDSLRCKRVNYLENEIVYGDYFLRIGNYESAVAHYNKALAQLSRQENKTLQAHVLLSLSNAQSKLKQEDRARTYLFQAHPVVVLLPDGARKVEALFDLSARYYYQYQVSGNEALLDSAQHAAGFGIAQARLIGYTQAFVRGYNLLEDKEYHSKNYRQALVYLDSALYFTQPGIQASERLGIYSDMADIYLELKKYDRAYVCADSSLVNARLVGNPYKVKNALELLYNCSKLNGEYERALTVYEDLVTMRDSVQKLENSRLFSELEEKYHRVRKEKSEKEYEQDKKLLNKQREIGQLRSKLITIGIVVSALLAFYIFIIFRQKNMSQRQKRLEAEQRLQRARINPDFIYKALTNLQQQSVSGSANEQLARKLGAFTKLIRRTLESSSEDFLTLDQELEFLRMYLDLQRDRLQQQFDYTFEVDERINTSDVCIPAMILQPFIEHSIERGFRGLNHPGMIHLHFELHGNELHIRIQDNGRGLKAGASARASEIINDRLYLLNKMTKTNASYLIRERSSGGVSVEIFLPLITREMAESNKRVD